MASVQNQGVRIDYETEGEGIPLVLLHGFAGDFNDWRRNVLEDFVIEKSHFMGYSMGGEVCFGIVQYDPERALSLII